MYDYAGIRGVVMPIPKPKDNEIKEETVKEEPTVDEVETDSEAEVKTETVTVGDERTAPEPVEVKLTTDIEKRFTDFTEYRIDEEEERKHIVGHVTVYKKQSVPIWNFVEKVRPAAFTESLNDDSIVKKSYFNHDPNIVLGNTENGSASFTDKRTGIWLDTIPPLTQAAQDVIVLVRDKYVNHASFAFTVTEERWSGTLDNPVREIVKGIFYEGGPVSDAAYQQTSVDVRALYRGVGIDFQMMRANVARYHLGLDMSIEQLDTLKRTIDKLSRALVTPPDSGESEAEIVTRKEIMEINVRRLTIIRDERS